MSAKPKAGPEDTIDSTGRVVIGGAVGSKPGTGTRPGTEPAVPAGGKTTTTTTTSSGSGGSGLSTDQQSAYSYLQQVLGAWDLTDLAPQVLGWIQQGVSDSNQLQILVEGTTEYQQKYGAVNQSRIASGLAPLTPAEQLATKEQYRQTMSQYGLPASFYSSDSELQTLLSADISPSELSDRAQMASTLVNSSPPSALAAFNSYYGTTGAGGAVAALLDPTKADSVLQNEVAAAQIGGTASDSGYSLSASRAGQFVQSGVTLAQARQAYQQIAQRAPTDQAIANRFGMSFGQDDEENASILGQADATRKQQLLYSEEAAQFGGHGSSSAGSTNDAGSNY